MATYSTPDDQDFRILKQIGEGGYGSVYLVQHVKWGDVVLKKLRDPNDSDGGELNSLRREADILKTLRHPNIVTFNEGRFESEFCGLFLEFVKCGSVDSFVKQFYVMRDWKFLIIYDISCAMCYLHEQQPPIIHGDLKCQNILIGNGFRAKVCDFGLARIQTFSKSYSDHAVRGTPAFIAPEYFQNPRKRKTEKYDVFSFAITVWKIFSGKQAHYDFADARLIPVSVMNEARPMMGEINGAINEALDKLIRACWNQEPKDRPTFDAIKESLRIEMVLIKNRYAGLLPSWQSLMDQTNSIPQNSVLSAILLVTLVNSSSLEPHRHSKRGYVSSPKDQVVRLGEQVRLECSTSLKDPMTWYFSSSDGSFHGDIYYSEIFIDSMKHRHQMDTSGTGRYSLVIPRVDKAHAGQYRCDDNEGLDKGDPVELTVLERRPTCTVIKSKPNNVVCSIEAAGSLELKITCEKGAHHAERKNNIYSFSEEFDSDNARTCQVCFTKEATGGCVFETGFEGIPESLGKTTLSEMLVTPNADYQRSEEKADNRTIVVAVIMTVIGVVIIAAIVVVAIKRKAVHSKLIEYRRRITRSQDPENPDGTDTDIQRKEFLMSPSLSTESGNSETPLNPKE